MEYTAFPEEWTRVEWSYGSIRDRNTGAYYTYDGANVKFNVLNITDGEINNYAMEQGRDYNAYLVKNGSAVTEIYIVVGDLAYSYTAGINTPAPTQTKDNAKYTYFVKDNLITNFTKSVFATDWPTVILEGTTNIPDWDYDSSTNTASVEVEYNVWKDWLGKAFVITPDTGNQIALSDAVSFTTDSLKVGVMATETGKTADQKQTVVVYSQSLTPVVAGSGTKAYTFTITYKAARDKAALTSLDNDIATVTKTTIAVVDPMLSINEFMENFKVSDGADVKWTFINAQGEVAEKDYFQTMQNVKYFSAVVTAEDGTVVTYLSQSYVDDAMDAARTEVTSVAESDYFKWDVYVGTSGGTVKANQLPDVQNALTKLYADLNAAVTVEDAKTIEDNAQATLKAALKEALYARAEELLGGRSPSWSEDDHICNNWSSDIATAYKTFLTKMENVTLDVIGSVWNDFARPVFDTYLPVL